MKMDGRVFGLLWILCLFIAQTKAQGDENIEQTQQSLMDCTCMKSDKECNQIKSKCEDEICSVREVFECQSCKGMDCDCVYSPFEERVAEVCVTKGDGSEMKRGLKKVIKKIKEKIYKVKKKLRRFFGRKRKNRRQRRIRKNNKGEKKPKAPGLKMPRRPKQKPRKNPRVGRPRPRRPRPKRPKKRPPKEECSDELQSWRGWSEWGSWASIG
ncbi:uncharacterized protein LOC133179671 [Saccostrea echinata]|uniref:uncharacterized protein LOC133179671 n=1 Tax=Saccostrea echinata TaxID=191078 RepID=UPI002A814682|nr:uncharacterized protein LOC133179671 [Saccostrea echinata]